MIDQAVKWLAGNASVFQAVTNIVSILGIPIVIALYIRNARRDDLVRREKIYDDVDESFVKFLQLILNYPQLNVTWFDSSSQSLSDNEKTQQYLIFDLLTNMFERAFLTYEGASDRQRKQQWQGWREYIDQYCSKRDYQAWWLDERHSCGGGVTLTYDKSFEKFMLARLAIARENRADAKRPLRG